MTECTELLQSKNGKQATCLHANEHHAYLSGHYPCVPSMFPSKRLHSFAWRCLCCVSARFAPDGCNQRLQRHPLPTLWASAQHSRGGCHWTDVCWPAQLLVAGACHLARPRFISTSVTWWKKITCHRWQGQAPASTPCLYAVITLTWRCVSSFRCYWLAESLSDKWKKKKKHFSRFCLKPILGLFLSVWSLSRMAGFIILKKTLIVVILKKDNGFSLEPEGFKLVQMQNLNDHFTL